MKVTQWTFGIAALIWWALYLIDPMVFHHLAAALLCTLAWFLITVKGVR